MANNWEAGLFGCFENCKICILTYFVPCYVFGKIAESVGESCGLCGFCIMMPIGNLVSWLKIREKVRQAKGIEGSCCDDFLKMACCGFCALVQMAREQKIDEQPQAQSMGRD